MQSNLSRLKISKKEKCRTASEKSGNFLAVFGLGTANKE